MSARNTVGPDANVERVGADLYRETRSEFTRFRAFLKSSASGGVLGMAAVAIAVEPGTVDTLLPLSALYAAWVLTRRIVLPFRLPFGAKRLDYNHPSPKNRRPRMAAGILYLGRDYKTGQELWISNEDGRQHVAVPGTTGAGKTAALVSLCANTLAWGSGFIFVDGKADNRLYADVLALARMVRPRGRRAGAELSGRVRQQAVRHLQPVRLGQRGRHPRNPGEPNRVQPERRRQGRQPRLHGPCRGPARRLDAGPGVDARHPWRADRHREHPLRHGHGKHRLSRHQPEVPSPRSRDRRGDADRRAQNPRGAAVPPGLLPR